MGPRQMGNVNVQTPGPVNYVVGSAQHLCAKRPPAHAPVRAAAKAGTLCGMSAMRQSSRRTSYKSEVVYIESGEGGGAVLNPDCSTGFYSHPPRPDGGLAAVVL